MRQFRKFLPVWNIHEYYIIRLAKMQCMIIDRNQDGIFRDLFQVARQAGPAAQHRRRAQYKSILQVLNVDHRMNMATVSRQNPRGVREIGNCTLSASNPKAIAAMINSICCISMPFLDPPPPGFHPSTHDAAYIVYSSAHTG